MSAEDALTAAAEARWLLEDPSLDHDRYRQRAQVLATLAVAEEARTANLLAMLASEPRGGRRDRIEREVLARLGLS